MNDQTNQPSASCSPAYLKARAEIAHDLYRQGRVTRIEAFRVALDYHHRENTGELQMELNDDHEFMMNGVGVEHDKYRRRQKANNE